MQINDLKEKIQNINSKNDENLFENKKVIDDYLH